MKKQETVLVVDDDHGMCRSLQAGLAREGYNVPTAHSGEEGLRLGAETNLDVVLLDLSMPGMGGLETLKRLKNICPDLPVIMITGYGTIETAVTAMKEGAYDYVTKPFEMSQIRAVVRNALRLKQLTEENRRLREQLAERHSFGKIFAKSRVMQDVFTSIQKIAATDATALILGESGTGKELVAQAVHYNSTRRQGPFVKLSCAAIPDSLLESELFGHEKGAFTGAITQRPGRFEIADGGTIFLDEIGDMTALTQVKLLRVLQEREFERLGGVKTIKVDVRVIAATNKDLRQEVANGRFREDLYYRLNVMRISLPPLRDRKEDVPLLAEHFLAEFAHQYNRPGLQLHPNALRALCASTWPGNVRELRNVLEQAVTFCEGRVILERDLPPEVGMNATPAAGFAPDLKLGETMDLQSVVEQIVEQTERGLIEQSLERHGWRLKKVASALGVSEKTLYNKMKRYGLSRDE